MLSVIFALLFNKTMMYSILISSHSVARWLILISILIAIYTGIKGQLYKLKFSKKDDLIRHWTATIAHIQLTIGIILYTQSPFVSYFWKNFNKAIYHLDSLFFGIIHILIMIIAIVIITIGSSIAKRKQTDKEKFKTIWIFYSIALILILMAIPWPFSPLATRPYIR